MRSLLIFILLFVSSVFLSSCSIYRMSIRQGNIVEQKDVDIIEKGMTKDQVRYILGRPVVNDTFGDDEWYYINTIKSGKTGETTQTRLIVTFDGDKVQALSGDFTIPASFN